MATAKKKKGRPRPKYKSRRLRQRLYKSTEAARTWRMWCHDVDTLLHAMVQQPGVMKVSPTALIAKAEAFADAYYAMQMRRRPAELTPDDDRY